MTVGAIGADLNPIDVDEDTPLFASYPALTLGVKAWNNQLQNGSMTWGTFMSYLIFHLKKEKIVNRPTHRKFLQNRVDKTFLVMLDNEDLHALGYWSQFVSGTAAMAAVETLGVSIPTGFVLNKTTAPGVLLQALLEAAVDEDDPVEEPGETWEPDYDEDDSGDDSEDAVEPEPEPAAAATPKLPVSSKKLSEVKGLTRAILIQMSQKALGAKNSTLSVGALLELVEADAPLVVRHTGHKAHNQTPIFADWAWQEATEGIPAHILVHYTYEEQEAPDLIIHRKWEPKKDADGNPIPHKCPKCGTSAKSSSEDDLIALFGRLRVVKSKTKKGVVHRERPQSHCKACRAGHSKKKKQAEAENQD
jgi:hypothetical protein